MSGNKTGRPRQDAAKRKSIQGREHLYSLYTSTPKPQALNSLPSSTAHPGFRRAEDKVVAHLDELYQDGGAVCTLRSILMKEAKRAGKGTWRQEDRKRAGRGESEGERESEDGGDEVSEAKVSKKRKRARRGELQLELPEMQRPEVDLPEDLPPGDLLTSIHQRASTLLSTSFNILPPLTLSAPRHSPSTIAHFDALTDAQANGEIDQLTAYASLRTYKAVAGARVVKAIGEKSSIKQIGNHETWRNAERGFEASALVAIGMFIQLLAADTVSKALVHAASPELLEQGRTSGASQEKSTKGEGKGKGKEKAVDQDEDVGDENEDEEAGAEMSQLEAVHELLDPSALVARALGSAGGLGLSPEDEIGIAGGSRIAVR